MKIGSAVAGSLATLQLASLSVAASAAVGQDLRHLAVTEAWSSEASPWTADLSRVVGLGSSAGTLWISDALPGRLHVVDLASDRLLATKTQGEGPDEVDAPGLVAAMPDGRIAVYDLGRVAIDAFSAAGEFERRLRLPVRVAWTKGFAVLPNGNFVVSGPVSGVDGAIHEFGSDGVRIASWGRMAVARDPRAAMIGTGGALHALDDGSLLYSQGAPHRIVRYSLRGDVEAGTDRWREEAVAEAPEMFDAPGDAVVVEGEDENGQWFRSFHVTYPQSKGIYARDDGSILNVVSMEDDDRSGNSIRR